MNKKQKANKVVKYIMWKALGAFVFVAVAGTSIWALAAFTEPTDTPSNSVQDWAKNIMGSNNSDNAFDSSSVTANSSGSMIERLENLENKQNVTAMSTLGPRQSLILAATYCFDLAATAEVANMGSNTSTIYTDWRLGTIGELAIFFGSVVDTSSTWTTTPYEAVGYNWYVIRLGSGYWNYDNYGDSNYTRCIR